MDALSRVRLLAAAAAAAAAADRGWLARRHQRVRADGLIDLPAPLLGVGTRGRNEGRKEGRDASIDAHARLNWWTPRMRPGGCGWHGVVSHAGKHPLPHPHPHPHPHPQHQHQQNLALCTEIKYYGSDKILYCFILESYSYCIF